MDRRTLLAIVLSTAVIIIFNVFVIPHPERTPATRGARADSSLAGSERPTQSLISPDRGVNQEWNDAGSDAEPAIPSDGLDLATEEETVEIDSGLYTARFTNRGGQLVSWKLHGFDNPVGDPVELVLGGRELGLTLDTDSGVIDLRNTLFSMNRVATENGGARLIFEAGTPGGLRVVKTFTLPAEGYLVGLDVNIQGAPQANSYRLRWDDGIPRAEKNPKQYDMAQGAIVLVGKNKETKKPKDFKKESRKEIEGSIHWAGVRNKYFMAVMVPPEETSSLALATGDNERKIVGAQLVMPLLQGRADHAFHVYLGPMDYDGLKREGYQLDAAVDLGWKLFRPVAKLLLQLMTWMYGFIPNYGWVIVIISVLSKLVFYPLTRTSIRSMRAMQQLQPEMSALKEKYKKDPQKMQAETMALYKKHKVNPAGGCLPILVQMPVFIALYQVLSNTIAMRNANFMFWINDLSSPDTIGAIAGFSIHVLPILLLITAVAQQMLTPMSSDPRQKMMGYMMPLVTLFIFYSFPSGLNLYWTVNNLLQVIQQWFIHREMPSPAPAAKPA